MKNLILKYFLISLTVFLTLPSCIKDMEIDVPDTNREVVVTCLFNPQEKWKLTLSETKKLQESEDIFIDNANVEITSETGEIIPLSYTGEKGIYSGNSYPEMGKTYTLKIDIPGHKEITAESMVPNFVKATIPDFDIKWIKFLYPNDLIDYDAFPLQVIFTEPIQDARFLFRAYTFNPREGYKRYMLTMESLKKLEQAGLPVSAYNELLKMVDQWHLYAHDFVTKLIGRVDDNNIRMLSSLLQQELKQKTVSTREHEAFMSAACFGNDFWLNNISYDVTTVIGEGQNINQADLLYSEMNLKYNMGKNSPMGWEFWLEAIQGSKAYTDYYRSYILQVSQRINPYSEPVMVQSNINNATGVFAGFNQQMIYLFTF